MNNLQVVTEANKFYFKEEIKKLTGFHRVSVSPDLAKRWLEFNYSNRNPKPSRVERYARIMKSGKWLCNGETLKFLASGEFKDGQNRLMGVIKCGKTIDFDVVFGLPDEASNTIDEGLKRSPGDVFDINGIPYSSNAAAIAKKILSFQISFSRNFSASETPSNEEVLDFYLKDESLKELVQSSCAFYNSSDRLLSTTLIGAFLYFFRKKDAVKADIFMAKLCSGSGLEEGSPILLLRRKLLNAKLDKESRMKMPVKHALIIKAWNLYRKGKTASRLFFTLSKDKFPKII